MALTEEQLKHFAKNTSTTQAVMKSLYSHLWRAHGKDKVDIDFLGKHLKHMKSLEYSIKEYTEECFHLDDFKPKQKAMTKQEIQDQLHKELNEKVHDNERIKLGYNKRQWAEIKRYEKMMMDYLVVAVPKFSELMIMQSITADDEASVELFTNMENKWKDFCRKHIINRYPGSDKNGKVRDNILNLFASKVSSLLGKQRKNPVTI